jgi:hypothetical protein
MLSKQVMVSSNMNNGESISRKIRLAKKNSSEVPYSRLSLDNSLDYVNDEEVREQHIIRIPRYF